MRDRDGRDAAGMDERVGWLFRSWVSLVVGSPDSVEM